MADDFTPFATVEDVEGRWHTLTAAERDRCALLLEDATQVIMDECPGWRRASARTLTAVTVAMVVRKMIVADDRVGVTNSQQTAGSFSESFTYSNPMGDLYLTSAEKARVNGGRGRAFHVDMAGANAPRIAVSTPLEGNGGGV